MMADFVHYPTDYLRRCCQEGGFRSAAWIKVGWGVDECVFQPRPQSESMRILFVGQVAEHKGAHVAIEALGLLQNSGLLGDLQLTIAGECLSAGYQQHLADLVNWWRVKDAIQFSGKVAREDLPGLYGKHSILVFPSTWQEPMGIVILEAMACGLAVLSSGSGGSRELTDDGNDGLLFAKADVADCAGKIAQLIDHPELLAHIRWNARQSVLERFRFETTLDAIAADLERRCARAR
jgi:glycosyltransferase involved in cell wall biosynthesis